MDSGTEDGYSVSDVARMVGVSPSTLRAWENHGLIGASRDAAGWRRYDAGEVTRAREVHRLREVEGLPVHAIARRLHAVPARQQRRAPGRTAGPTAGDLGARLRERRIAKGISLRALAVTARVSPSLVSGVERGLVQPSIASVQKLSTALGTTMTALVAVPAPACQLLGGELVPLDIPIPGVRIEELSGSAQLLEPQRFTIEPGQGSGGEYAHDGEEFLYVLEGTLSITLDRHEQFDVEAGMSLCFESTRRHRWWNPGTVTTRVLWINTPRTF